MNENPVISEEFFTSPAEGPINNFIDKYKGILTAIVSIAMIILIVYLIANIEILKMSPIDYCAKMLNNSNCYCLELSEIKP